jgi:hypothetical protein
LDGWRHEEANIDAVCLITRELREFGSTNKRTRQHKRPQIGRFGRGGASINELADFVVSSSAALPDDGDRSSFAYH